MGRWVQFSEVSKDLCKLSSELPFDIDECELVAEEGASGGVDLKKLVQARPPSLLAPFVAPAPTTTAQACPRR